MVHISACISAIGRHTEAVASYAPFMRTPWITKSETSKTQQNGESEKNDKPIQDEDLVICRCEEITRGEIINAIRNGMRTLNGVKRITRAGMGLCQGQTCQRLVAQIMTEELRLSAAEIDPTTARGPVRPLRLEVFANS